MAKKPPRARQEFVHYLARISSWDYHYGFRVGDPKYDSKAVDEIALLKFSANILFPDGGKHKTLEVTLSAKSGLLDPKNDHFKSIGMIDARGDLLHAYIWVPDIRMAELSSVASSGRWSVMSLIATSIRYRKASVINFSLDTDLREIESE